jgi:hypothetical protein
MLLTQGRGNDDVRELFAHDFVPAVAKGALRSRIEFSDAGQVIDRNYTVER